MVRSIVWFAALCPCLAACGSSSSGGTPPSATSESGAFNPPPALEGYTRIVSQSVPVPPSADVTYCQYVMAPLDHDVDVLAVTGYQSKFGHHAAALTYTPEADEVPGSSFPCMGTEFGAAGSKDAGAAAFSAILRQGSFLGAIGGASGKANTSSLPDGVAFRLTKGQGIMLNVHYINTGEVNVDGNAVLDLKLAETDPNRKIASLFANLNIGFNLPPDEKTSSTVNCVAQSDLKLLMMSNHMHEQGVSASTGIVPAGGGDVVDLHTDPTWTSDMQFNPTYTKWTVDEPFIIHAGDTIRTTCNWENTTSATLTFPREMCLGVGFVLTTSANPTAPLCNQGTWMANGP